jgi:LGFP repeat
MKSPLPRPCILHCFPQSRRESTCLCGMLCKVSTKKTLCRVMVTVVVMLILVVHPSYAQLPPAICASIFQPTGAIAARWALTGGATGPMGCAVSAEQSAPGGTGRLMQFQNGQIVTSPGQGTNMTVAVYQQEADLILEWGDTSPYNYDFFIVRWDKNGINIGQRDVPNGFRTRGLWFVPLPVAGVYTIIVEGCDMGNTCNQHWTVPVTITYVPLQPPALKNPSCRIRVFGPILDRWIALGGDAGPLGCPTVDERKISGTKASVGTFQHGQIVWDPDRGTNLTIAAYQVESDIAVEWGSTLPFSYHHFNVLWSKDGIPAPQVEVDQYLDANGNSIYSGLNDHGIYSIRGVGPGTYTIKIEGCDSGFLSSSCIQKWTTPATVHLEVLGSSASGVSLLMPPQCLGSPPVGGVIGEQWIKLWTDGPLLGCPMSTEQAISGTKGRFQTFQSGQIVWSPDQGADMVVALYQNGSNLGLAWGDTFPFHYDKFIVRLSNYPQIDYTSADGQISGGDIPVSPPNIPSPNNPPLTDGTYSAIVEGCDTGLNAPTCTQSWTIPVRIPFVKPKPSPPPLVPDEFWNGIDFSQLTPATTPVGARAELFQRGITVAKYAACKYTFGDVFHNEEPFMEAAIAKLNLVSNSITFCDTPTRPLPLRAEVNSALRFQQIKSKSGSTSDDSKCPRTGEYDVALTGYTTIVNRFGALLDNDVRNHIVNDLLNLRGPLDVSELFYCTAIPESENHLMMMLSSQYLTNQLLYEAGGDILYDNEANGMNNWLLTSLQAKLQHDFIEYNSKPYQTYTDNGLQNLFDFAKDRRVKMGARLVLDYISAKYAGSSNSLRRNAPYRRRVGYYSTLLIDKNADAQNSRFTLLSGMFQLNGSGYMHKNVLSAGYSEDANMLAVSSYRAPDMILDLLMTPSSHGNFFQRIHHDGVEIYSSRPDYLITAGGYWMGAPYTLLGAGSSDDDGPAVPTTLMPTDQFIDSRDLIRIDGVNVDSIDTRERMNTCVAPDFACGVNPYVPEFYTHPEKYGGDPSCYMTTSAAPNAVWHFVDSSSPGCNNGKFGFYAAVYIAKLSASESFGFFEAHPRDPKLSFDAFWNGVVNRNAQRTFSVSSTNTYVMTSGATIQFTIPMPGSDKYSWPVVSTGDPNLDLLGTDISKWPLASGDILNSDGNSGLVTFSNPGTGQRLILDFRDNFEPKRTEIK